MILLCVQECTIVRNGGAPPRSVCTAERFAILYLITWKHGQCSCVVNHVTEGSTCGSGNYRNSLDGLKQPNSFASPPLLSVGSLPYFASTRLAQHHHEEHDVVRVSQTRIDSRSRDDRTGDMAESKCQMILLVVTQAFLVVGPPGRQTWPKSIPDRQF
nr:hypothetical protein CFP56_41400 [Quercus suber]